MNSRNTTLDKINPKRDMLDKILADEDFQPIQKADGTWITTKAEWSQLYKSVEDIENIFVRRWFL